MPWVRHDALFRVVSSVREPLNKGTIMPVKVLLDLGKDLRLAATALVVIQ